MHAGRRTAAGVHRGAHDSALTSARRAVALQPNDVEARANLALNLSYVGKNAEATAEMDFARQLDPIPALAGGDEPGFVNTGYFGTVAIRGYDPVAYFTDGRAVQGNPDISYTWLGADWYFASENHQ